MSNEKSLFHETKIIYQPLESRPQPQETSNREMTSSIGNGHGTLKLFASLFLPTIRFCRFSYRLLLSFMGKTLSDIQLHHSQGKAQKVKRGIKLVVTTPTTADVQEFFPPRVK